VGSPLTKTLLEILPLAARQPQISERQLDRFERLRPHTRLRAMAGPQGPLATRTMVYARSERRCAHDEDDTGTLGLASSP
jgi:hypothetical protein